MDSQFSVFRFLYFGDVVGTAGVKTMERLLPLLKQALAVDAAFVNAENAAPGNGLTPAVAARLYAAGADAMTLGNHTWQRKELQDYLPQDKRLARPANGSPAWPGQGYAVLETPKAVVYLINLLGQIFLQAPESPFRAADDLLSSFEAEAAAAKTAVAETAEAEAVVAEAAVLASNRPRIVIVDMHAEATAEKVTMGRYLDGRVAAVVGTHTHVATADACVLPGGTAYITDLGMCGPTEGVIGMDPATAVRRLVDCLPARYEVAKGATALSGMMVDYDLVGKRALDVWRLSVPGYLTRFSLPALLAEQTAESEEKMFERLDIDKQQEGLTGSVKPGEKV